MNQFKLDFNKIINKKIPDLFIPNYSLALTIDPFGQLFDIHRQQMGNSHQHNHQSEHNHSHKQGQPRTWNNMDGSQSRNNPQVKEEQKHSQNVNPNKLADQQGQIVMNFPQFGGEVVVDKQKKVIVREIQIFQFEEKFVESILAERIKLKHPNFITVKQYRFQQLSDNPRFLQKQKNEKGFNFCYPQSKVLKIQFQPAVLSVQELVKSYCQQRKPIQEQQIRRIIKGVVQCLIYLRNNNTYHGDIKPTTIFIHPKTKQIKLLDSVLLNNGRVAFDIIKEDPRSESFLTPQQLEKNKHKVEDTLQNIHESEVFCIGLTMIQMMTIQASMEAYNLQLLEIKPQFLPRKLEQMQEYGYSYQLADLALRCIQKNKSFRPKFQQLMKDLQ